MVTVTKIRKTYGSGICRRCINREFGTGLERRDCRYEKHSNLCPVCGEQKHIVKRLTVKGYCKCFFRHESAGSGSEKD